MSEDQKPPHIRFGVANDQRELDRRNAELDLNLALKRLAAKLVRIVTGASPSLLY
jgi:hypothetical protein